MSAFQTSNVAIFIDSLTSILVTIHFDRTLTLIELSLKADFSFSFFFLLINRYFVTHLHALARETLFSCHQIRLAEFIADLHTFCSRQICHKISEMKLWHVVHNEQRENIILCCIFDCKFKLSIGASRNIVHFQRVGMKGQREESLE